MATTLDEKIARLDPDHQAEIATEVERLRAAYLTLRDLRKVHELTPTGPRSDLAAGRRAGGSSSTPPSRSK